MYVSVLLCYFPTNLNVEVRVSINSRDGFLVEVG